MTLLTHIVTIPLGPAGPRYRPCAECQALVPATGCMHWRPGVSVAAMLSERHRGRRADARNESRARQRAAAKLARDAARDRLLSSIDITIKEEE